MKSLTEIFEEYNKLRWVGFYFGAGIVKTLKMQEGCIVEESTIQIEFLLNLVELDSIIDDLLNDETPWDQDEFDEHIEELSVKYNEETAAAIKAVYEYRKTR